MSTKTLRKRIALVAVSALGFGLLSAAPSSATVTQSTALTASGIGRDAYGMTMTFTGNAAIGTGSAWTQEYAHYRFISSTAAPLDSTNPIAVTTGQVALGLYVGSSATAAEVAARNKGTVDLAHTGTGINLRPGVYTFLAWVNTTDSSSQAAPGVSDPSVRYTVTVAGAPASITLTSPAASVAASATTNAAYVATVKDANGVNTLLGASETITVRAAYTVGAVVIDTTTARAGSSLATSATTGTALTSSNAVASGAAGYINNWSFALANSLATSTTVAVAGAGLITGITGASSTLTTISVSYPTSVDVSSGTTFSDTAITIGVGSGATLTAPVAQTAATTGYAVTASTVHGLSATFRAIGTAADTFDYTIAALSTTTPLPTGVTVGTYTTAAVGSTTLYTNFTVTATAATSGSGYKVTIPFSATTNIVFNVTYAAPTVSSTLGTVVMTPTSGDSAKALIGSAVTVTATVKDQFGKAFAGANVVWSANTRKTTNLASNASTDALGQSSYSYTDTVATAGSETFNANVSAPTATTTLQGSTSVAFGLAASVAVTTLTVTSNKAAATTGNLVDAVIIETATVKDSSNTALRGIPVTMSISANGYAVSTVLTAWSNSSGQVVMEFAGKTVGTATVTVTAGDKTATDAIVVITSTAKSRAITLSDATVAITGGDTKKITATVRDGYGNAVEGQSLTVSYAGTAGRVAAVGGVIGSTGSTDEDGNLIIDITAALTESGTGTLTVAGTMGDASAATVLLNVDGVTALPAKVASATTAATITASNAAALADAAANKSILDAIAAIATKAAADKAESDAKIKLLEAQIAATQAAAVAAAEAAADAAAEAIDAGNNAYDSANAATDAADAATAAAQQAGEDAVAAAEAAGAAAVEAAQSAQDAAAEATDAATAATDAANAAAEAADASTAAAQDAADAVAALSVQVTEVVASLKKQITALTNLVIRIQKKVKA
jgi:hypothetical protein